MGIIQGVTMPENDNDISDLNRVIVRLLVVSVFVLLPSFAPGVAGKYLRDRQGKDFISGLR